MVAATVFCKEPDPLGVLGVNQIANQIELLRAFFRVTVLD